MMALQAGGQIMQHQAQGRAVRSRNRTRLRNFDLENKQYLEEAMLDDNEWKNDVQVQDIDQDKVYQAMITQWSEQDQQLDKIFAQGDQKIEKAIVEMYENEYAGTQTGRTAGRLAAKGAKKLGQYKSQVLHNMMMASDEATLGKQKIRQAAQDKSHALYEKIRFAPIHGHTPIAPELEAQPGKGGLILGLALSGLGAAKAGGMFKAPDVGKGLGIADPAMVDKMPDLAGQGAFAPGGTATWPTTTQIESFASPNMDWGGLGDAPWVGQNIYDKPVGEAASLDTNFFKKL